MKKSVILNRAVFDLIFSRREIEKEVRNMASQIKRDYERAGNLLLLFVSNGGIYFGVDLSRALDELGVKHEVDTLKLSSYTKEGAKKKEVKIMEVSNRDFTGKNVIVIDDIVDSGDSFNTLLYFLTHQDKQPKSLEFCSLFLRRGSPRLNRGIKYGGQIVEDGWLAGYGMDYSGLGRSLSAVYIQRV